MPDMWWAIAVLLLRFSVSQASIAVTAVTLLHVTALPASRLPCPVVKWIVLRLRGTQASKPI